MLRWYLSPTPNFFSDWLWPYCAYIYLHANITTSEIFRTTTTIIGRWCMAPVGYYENECSQHYVQWLESKCHIEASASCLKQLTKRLDEQTDSICWHTTASAAREPSTGGTSCQKEAARGAEADTETTSTLLLPLWASIPTSEAFTLDRILSALILMLSSFTLGW